MWKRSFQLIVILALIIVAIVVVRTPLEGRNQASKLRIKVSRMEMPNLSMALEYYKTNNGAYPTTEQGLKALLQKPTIPPIPKNWDGPYLKDEPIDPWENPYQYRCPSQHNSPDFDLWSFGPDGKDGTEDDFTNWAPFPKIHNNSSIPAYFNIRVIITIFLLLFLLFLIFPRKKESDSPPL